jgi:hypothetical protein
MRPSAARNQKVLARKKKIRIVDLVAIGVIDFVPEPRVAIEIAGDMPQVVAGLDVVEC